MIVISGKMTRQKEEGTNTERKTMTEGIVIVIGTRNETDVNATENEKGTEIGIGIETGTIEAIGKGRVIDTEIEEDMIKLQLSNILYRSLLLLVIQHKSITDIVQTLSRYFEGTAL